MKQINKQAGFTLIELIMVIVILGVLSAFALPRFADLGGEARTASIQGLAGAIKSAANIAHAQALIDGGDDTDTVSLEGQDVTMIGYYPTANTAGITIAAQINAGASLDSADYIVAGGGATAAATITYSLKTNCQVGYTAATAAVTTPGSEAAAIPFSVTSTVSGC